MKKFEKIMYKGAVRSIRKSIIRANHITRQAEIETEKPVKKKK
jgi:hypothetical protein